ncbi:MAG: S41 family peptidase [Acidobacteriota bacterium]
MTEHHPTPSEPLEPGPDEDGLPPAPTGPWPSHAPLAGRPGPTAPPRFGFAAWVVGLALASVVGSLLFLAGYFVAGGSRPNACSAPSSAFQAFCDAYDKLKSEYVDPLSDTKLAEGAIQGMFQYGVQDPFSGYMAPQQYQQALGDLSGKFSGIGAEMAVKNTKTPADLAACTQLSDTCVLVVVAPISGSPAEKAGLQPGDIVLAVDGASVNGSTINDQVSKVRGPAGTQVTLSIHRDTRTFDVTITRAEITTSEVTAKLIDGHVGYIALHVFSEASPTEFHDALKKLLDEGATQIVFDLRNNGGGYIIAAQKIASEFVSSGLIFTQESADNKVATWDAVSGGLATNPKIPVVVLVNGGTASASEIVTAALKEHDRATIIGQSTFGKNTVQVWSPLSDGGGVRITISRWFTPDHTSVHPGGVQPDIAVTIPTGTPPEQDLILQRALSFLSAQTGSTGAVASPSPAGTVVPTTPTPSPAPSVAPAAAGSAGLVVGFEPAGLTVLAG